MRKIQLLCGGIASGKSSYCRNAAKAGYVICNDDAIVNLIHGGEYTLYNKEFKSLYKTIENTIVNSAILFGKTVVIDSGRNVNKSRRKRFTSWAKAFGVQCEAIVFKREAPEVHAKRRFDSDNRGRSYEWWLNVAQEHHRKYTRPYKHEGFCQVYEISYEEIMQGKVL